MKRKIETEEKPVAVSETLKPWEFFFRCQRNPIYRSQLLTSIMTGTVLKLERLPTQVLLDVVLLSTASRNEHNAEIVSDYAGLLEKVREEWARPDWTCRVFNQIHARWANTIVTNGTKDFGDLEEKYIPSMVGALLEADVPDYFSVEFQDEKALAKYRRAA